MQKRKSRYDGPKGPLYTSVAEGKEDLGENPTQSASARSGTASGQRGEGSIEVFGGCPSVPLRVRDTVWKYAGDRKTEGL